MTYKKCFICEKEIYGHDNSYCYLHNHEVCSECIDKMIRKEYLREEEK
jgi:hypothetical protein